MNPDDPKLTAYALDELDPAERAEIERLIRDDPAARAELVETMTFTARLRSELKTEAGVPLTGEQRAALLSLDKEQPAAEVVEFVAKQDGVRWTRLWLPLAAALCLVASVAAVMRNHVSFLRRNAAIRSDEILASASTVSATLANTLTEPLPALTTAGPKAVTASPAVPDTLFSLGNVTVGEPTAAPRIQTLTTMNQSNLSLGIGETMFNSGALIRGDSAAGTETGSHYVASVNDRLKKEGAGNLAVPAARAMTRGGLSPAAAEKIAGMTAGWRLGGASSMRGRPGGDRQPGKDSTLTKSVDEAGSENEQIAQYTKLLEELRKEKNILAPTERSFSTAAYDAITDNAFLAVRENPLSTFSIDVDTASYANVRRFLNQQSRPPKGAVRIEELLNYFTYDYPQPEGDAPFSATMEVAACPWAPEHRLVRVGLKGREIREEKRPASNLVFLIDVSGSMQPQNKLPLLKQCLAMLVDRLSAEDTVSIAVYAGASGCVLEPTSSKRNIRDALDRLESGGSTNGAAGIQLAYRLAEQSFIKGGVNRVILATDGDFNVGVTSQSELVDLIERKAKGGVFLTVLGFGMDNLKDSTLEKLADKGNGNYAYIDTLNEGRKVLVEQMNGTLVTIAKDVKIQVEFNPAQAAAYRLIGYENRLLAKEDFNDDKKDAGEIGAGHTVTALYEVVPAGAAVLGAPAVDALKYQGAVKSEVGSGKSDSSELLTLKLRYKQPDGDTSKLLEFPLTDRGETWEKSSRDFRFAAAVAGFGMLLRDSPHKGSATWDRVRELAMEGRGEDRSGYRGEFLTLLDKAKALAR